MRGTLPLVLLVAIALEQLAIARPLSPAAAPAQRQAFRNVELLQTLTLKVVPRASFIVTDRDPRPLQLKSSRNVLAALSLIDPNFRPNSASVGLSVFYRDPITGLFDEGREVPHPFEPVRSGSLQDITFLLGGIRGRHVQLTRSFEFEGYGRYGHDLVEVRCPARPNSTCNERNTLTIRPDADDRVRGAQKAYWLNSYGGPWAVAATTNSRSRNLRLYVRNQSGKYTKRNQVLPYIDDAGITDPTWVGYRGNSLLVQNSSALHFLTFNQSSNRLDLVGVVQEASYPTLASGYFPRKAAIRGKSFYVSSQKGEIYAYTPKKDGREYRRTISPTPADERVGRFGDAPDLFAGKNYILQWFRPSVAKSLYIYRRKKNGQLAAPIEFTDGPEGVVSADVIDENTLALSTNRKIFIYKISF